MRTAHERKNRYRISVRLPERFGRELPCTFGTQLNVFSRESSIFRFGQMPYPKDFTGVFLLLYLLYTLDTKSQLTTRKYNKKMHPERVHLSYSSVLVSTACSSAVSTTGGFTNCISSSPVMVSLTSRYSEISSRSVRLSVRIRLASS